MKISEAKKLLLSIPEDNVSLRKTVCLMAGKSEDEILAFDIARTADPDRIAIPLTSNKTLVAEENIDPDFKELFVFLENDKGVITQDLAIVGEQYKIEDCSIEPVPCTYYVNVFADSENEDYTDSFEIDEYQEPEEECE